MFTPWGAPKRSLRLEPGITAVITGRLGGLMLSRGYAESRLSEPARRRASRFGEYYAYDLQQAWVIPMLELPHLWVSLAAFCKPELQHNPRLYLRGAAASYDGDYLIEVDGAPASQPA